MELENFSQATLQRSSLRKSSPEETEPQEICILKPNPQIWKFLMNFSAVPRKILEFMQFYHYRIFAITQQTGARNVSNNENTSLQIQSGSCSPCLDICVEPYIVSRSRKASQHRCVIALLHTDAFLQYHTQHQKLFHILEHSADA